MYIKVYRPRFKWRVALMGRNGETVMVSQSYFSKGNAMRAGKQAATMCGLSIKVV